jgi:hypothetical protein
VSFCCLFGEGRQDAGMRYRLLRRRLDENAPRYSAWAWWQESARPPAIIGTMLRIALATLVKMPLLPHPLSERTPVHFGNLRPLFRLQY